MFVLPFLMHFFSDEGDGTGDGGGAPSGDGTPGGSDADNKDKGADNKDGKGEDGKIDLSTLPPAVQAHIREIRAEAKNERLAAKEAASKEAADTVMAMVQKALGKTPDNEQTTEQVLAQLAQEKQASQEKDRDFAVYRLAGKHNGDADMLLDSGRFKDTLKDIDLKDSAAIGEAIKAFVTANPRYAADKLPVGNSGADHSGTPGEKKDYSNLTTREALEKAL